mmetsp:Transcript_4040/g.6545  ORF Transcript_4040/g.6545 Transcript_4040/m.6545 type:complete len:255 (+) Transcript_4040:83-847(+)|eukprot:CAMPEP_0179412662 /NCGR_PEP_ID=MMETSP0799-20121207/4600_1 /TAXON_ID=46947 /ORGANISM="Geminigera cryophila, Strain CCMP2564" /LENGTH=254 /DNA_ID=CAMNT_0021184913 /DNA_START=74 /DNA_END=838 /DNA_ORIENTATION=-
MSLNHAASIKHTTTEDGTMQVEQDTDNVDAPVHSGWMYQKHDLWIMSYSSKVWCVLTRRGDLEMYKEGKVQPFQTLRLYTAADMTSDSSGLKPTEMKLKYTIISNHLKDEAAMKTVTDAMGTRRFVTNQTEDYDEHVEVQTTMKDAMGNTRMTKSTSVTIGGRTVVDQVSWGSVDQTRDKMMKDAMGRVIRMATEKPLENENIKKAESKKIVDAMGNQRTMGEQPDLKFLFFSTDTEEQKVRWMSALGRVFSCE